MVDSALRSKVRSRYEDLLRRFNPRTCHMIGEGTYGRVFRLQDNLDPNRRVALKIFKPARPGEGISLTVCREIALLRELTHPNIISVRDVVIRMPSSSSSSALSSASSSSSSSAHQTWPWDGPDDDFSVFMVFDYASHDLDQLIKFHKAQGTQAHPQLIKSVMFQILNGLHYLHSNWIIHRDMKPANTLIMGSLSSSSVPSEFAGTVKVADFGLARLFQSPLRRLGDDGPVVTIWYRAPELLLGSRHYTPAIDVWAAGCMFAELFLNEPLFCGIEQRPPQEGGPPPFQKSQLEKIFGGLGYPTREDWPDIESLEFLPMARSNFPQLDLRSRGVPSIARNRALSEDPNVLDLLLKLLTFDPTKRLTAAQALEHRYFKEAPLPSMNCFSLSTGEEIRYPEREELRYPHPSAPSSSAAASHHHHPHGQPPAIPQSHQYASLSASSSSARGKQPIPPSQQQQQQQQGYRSGPAQPYRPGGTAPQQQQQQDSRDSKRSKYG